MIESIYPEIMQAPTEDGVYMGVAVRAGHPRHMYLWQGQPYPKLPMDPCYFEPLGDRKRFWESVPIVWEGMEPALAGLTFVGTRKVPVFAYLRLLKELRKFVQGVSNTNTEHEVFAMLRRLLVENHGPRTPVILYTPSIKESDLKPIIRKEPIKGEIIPPPSI